MQLFNIDVIHWMYNLAPLDSRGLESGFCISGDKKFVNREHFQFGLRNCAQWLVLEKGFDDEDDEIFVVYDEIVKQIICCEKYRSSN